MRRLREGFVGVAHYKTFSTPPPITHPFFSMGCLKTPASDLFGGALCIKLSLSMIFSKKINLTFLDLCSSLPCQYNRPVLRIIISDFWVYLGVPNLSNLWSVQ